MILNRLAGCGSLLALLALVGGCNKPKKPSKLSTPDYVLEESSEPISAENPQVIAGDRFEDFYGAFTLRRPGTHWDFLTQEKAGKMNPDAAMGMISAKKGAYVVVISDSMPDLSLDEYCDIILDPTGILGSGTPPVKRKIGDLEAVHTDTVATLSGTQFHYRVTITQHGGHFYQLLGWSMDHKYAAAKSDIDSIINSFRPVIDRKPTVRENLFTADANGFGWEIKDRVYSNVATGFRVKCPEGCRLMGRVELLDTNPDADLGIGGGRAQMFQYWLVEPANDSERLAAYYTESLRTEIGAVPAGTKAVKVGGKDATEISFDGVMLGAAPMDYRMTWLEHDGYFYRLLTNSPPGQAAEAEVMLADTYRSVEFLDAAKRETLAANFKAAGYDPANSVGKDFSLRNGVFQDFAGGFIYRVPDGIFEMETSSTQINGDMDGQRLNVTNLRTGVYFNIGYSDRPDDHAEIHATVMADTTEKEETETRTLGGSEFLVTRYTSRQENLVFSHVYASAVGPTCLFEVSSTKVGEAAPGDDAEIDTMLAGLEWPLRPLEIIVQKPDKFTDHRLGYNLDTDQWKVTIPPAGSSIENMGSVIIVERGKVTGGVLVMCSPAGLDLDVAGRAMIENMGIRFDGASEKKSKSTLAGLPADHTTVTGMQGLKKATTHIWTARKANTGYVLFLIKQGTLSTDNATAMSKILTLIE